MGWKKDTKHGSLQLKLGSLLIIESLSIDFTAHNPNVTLCCVLDSESNPTTDPPRFVAHFPLTPEL